MNSSKRHFLARSGMLAAGAVLAQSAAAAPAKAPMPVIFDTDIGTDIDDTWALAQLLRCPELDPKLLLMAAVDMEFRTAICARFLERRIEFRRSRHLERIELQAQGVGRGLQLAIVRVMGFDGGRPDDADAGQAGHHLGELADSALDSRPRRLAAKLVRDIDLDRISHQLATRFAFATV